MVVVAPPDEVELAADVLWDLGVAAVEERTGMRTIELWSSVGDTDEALARLDHAIAGRWVWRTEQVDESVADSWRAFAQPVPVTDRLTIAPAWWTGPTHTAEVVYIEPGQSFGLGDHPTTVLCARALIAAVRPGQRVLDVGCGTGVLGIVAVLHGADHVHGIDIADDAIVTTTANALRNGVGDRCTASRTDLAGIADQFPVVVANILAPTLVDLADDLRRVVAPGGTLIVSGVLADRHDHVVAALAPLTVVSTDTLDGWAAVTLYWPV